MPNEILTKDGTAVVWADSTDYSSSVSGLTRTAQIDLTSLADTAARQGAKVDLGATRARRYLMVAALEYAVAPASGEIAEFYLGESPSGTAGNANPGGLSGSDAAYTGTAGDSLADSVKQLRHVGNMVLTADATTTVQYQAIGIIEDVGRHVSVAVKNEGGQALHSDAVEMYVALLPLVDELQ